MKRRPKVSWIATRVAIVLGLAVFSAPAFAAAPAKSVDSYVNIGVASAPVVRFTSADYVLDDSDAAPKSGWRPGPSALTIARDRLAHHGEAPRTLWTRMRFPRGALGAGPLAVYTVGNRDRFQLFLNGAEIYRGFAAPDDPLVTWYEPALIPLPAAGLRVGVNEITARVVSRYDLGAGSFEVGSHAALMDRFRWMNLWRIDLARKVNFAMLVLAYGAALYWAFNRRETQFAIIAATSFLWCLSNGAYIFDRSPLGEFAQSAWTAYLFAAAAAGTALLVADVTRAVRRRAIVVAAAVVALCAALLLAFAADRRVADVALDLSAIGLLAWAVGIALRSWRRTRAAETLALWLTLTAMTVGAAHDLGRLWYVHGWNGLGFFVRPYDGFLLCCVFLFSFGRRSAAAFATLLGTNAELEARVAEARREVAVSEARRRELEIAGAMETERERLLREMHDGIGSNLVTALAVAEQQHQPANVIATLRRALSDLKITIDSLEPVEGDLVALLANLRHRMERDLRDAGLTCRWRVVECRSLPWLDATNALHVLRIFQEAIGNALTHAGASTLEIGCHEEARAGAVGVLAYVVDDGRGFDAALAGAGKGVGNMRSRARALHGAFECASTVGEGTRISLWLPYARDERAGS